MRYPRWMAPVALAAAVAIPVAGCAAADLATKSYSTDGKCIDLSDNLDNAQNDLTVATTHLQDDKGKPSVVKDRADIKRAKQNVAKLEKALKDHGWVAGCPTQDSATSSSAQTSSSAAATSSDNSDGTATVDESDGSRSLPLVDDNGTVIDGNSTGDVRTPATYADALKNGPVTSWPDFVNRMSGLKWYVDGVNAREDKTGMSWSDVKQFAAWGDDSRVIVVYNLSLTDAQARDAVRNLIGNAADQLPIKRYQSCVVNTRGFGHGTMQDFLDCRKMVRVVLAKIEVGQDGKHFANPDDGFFIDCFNEEWMPKAVHHAVRSPAASSTHHSTSSTSHSARTTSAHPTPTPSSSTTPTPTRTHTPAPTPTPTPTGKHASLTPSPTGGPVSTGPTSVSHPSSSAPATTTQPTLSSPPPEVQSPSPTSSSPPVTGDPGGA